MLHNFFFKYLFYIQTKIIFDNCPVFESNRLVTDYILVVQFVIFF
jgi:hypothetical protein